MAAWKIQSKSWLNPKKWSITTWVAIVSVCVAIFSIGVNIYFYVDNKCLQEEIVRIEKEKIKIAKENQEFEKDKKNSEEEKRAFEEKYLRLLNKPKMEFNYFFNADGAGFEMYNNGQGEAQLYWINIFIDEELFLIWDIKNQTSIPYINNGDVRSIWLYVLSPLKNKVDLKKLARENLDFIRLNKDKSGSGEYDMGELQFGGPSFINPVSGDETLKLMYAKSGLYRHLLTEYQKSIIFEGCYCSIFDECWVFSNAKPTIKLEIENKTCGTLFKANEQKYFSKSIQQSK